MPDEMRVHYFHKRFETQNVTGVYPPRARPMGDGAGRRAADARPCVLHSRKGDSAIEPERVALEDVGSIAISEVLFDLQSLASGAA